MRRSPSHPILYVVLLLALAASLASGAPAGAHDSELPIAGTLLSVSASGDPADRTFRFESLGQAPITLGHDPATTATWFVVRDIGAGLASTTSGRIDLDPSKWSPLQGAAGPGYEYVDPTGSRGGVTQVLLEAGNLSIAASGPSWSWVPVPTIIVLFEFGIADETWCARFPSPLDLSLPGELEATDALAPVSCTERLCSNGIVEVGEVCDDGNLDPNDGCTSHCEISECVGEAFESTWAALQEQLFGTYECSNAVCHGASPGAGNLDLITPGAHARLLEMPASGSGFDLIEPGEPDESALWLKLLKATAPEDAPIPGEPMPLGFPAVPPELLDALGLWIEHGAPETGTVEGTQALLEGCFDAPVPISIPPLEPPGPGEGVQFRMPGYRLHASSETENCAATYYDLSETVPPHYVSEDGESFFVESHVQRQDPHSHHLVIAYPGLDPSLADHPSFGTWRCVGGDLRGHPCDPLDTESCGAGLCRSSLQSNVACIGFGPPGGLSAATLANSMLGPIEPAPGRFTRLPIRGFIYWNSHAFNLTSVDHTMNARLNLRYARRQRDEVKNFTEISQIYVQAGQPPYTRATYCATKTFPIGTRVVSLTSHTHKRGERFWMEDAGGELIYQTFSYSDPDEVAYAPPLAFDSEDPVERSIRYCATYNNGVAPDGSPDPAMVRRHSFSPGNSGTCSPSACTAGKVGDTCFGANDDARCDSFAGAGDGECDACVLTAGASTEDEMFVMIGSVTTALPEPALGGLGLTVLSTLACLRRSASRSARRSARRALRETLAAAHSLAPRPVPTRASGPERA